MVSHLICFYSDFPAASLSNSWLAFHHPIQQWLTPSMLPFHWLHTALEQWTFSSAPASSHQDFPERIIHWTQQIQGAAPAGWLASKRICGVKGMAKWRLDLRVLKRWEISWQSSSVTTTVGAAVKCAFSSCRTPGVWERKEPLRKEAHVPGVFPHLGCLHEKRMDREQGLFCITEPAVWVCSQAAQGPKRTPVFRSSHKQQALW